LLLAVVGAPLILLRSDNDGKDPITGETLSENDLLEIKTCKRSTLLSLCPSVAATPRHTYDEHILKIARTRKADYEPIMIFLYSNVRFRLNSFPFPSMFCLDNILTLLKSSIGTCCPSSSTHFHFHSSPLAYFAKRVGLFHA
jgi:hypothetical protein